MFQKFQRFHYPDPDGGGEDDLSAADRGDSFTPTDATDEEEALAAVAASKAAAKAEADAVEAKALKDAEELAAGKKKDEPEQTDEEKAAAAAKAAEDEAAAKKGKDTRIPASRHKEILDKEREKRELVEAELAKYKQGKTIAAVNEDIGKAEAKLITLEEEHSQLSLDGKVKEAAAKMTEIRKLERSIVEQQSEFKIAAAEARAVERVRYDVACDRVEEAYPQLKEGSAEFDAEKSKEVVELQTAYKLTGLTPTAALQKAVKLIMGAPETKKQADAVDVTPKVNVDDVDKGKDKAAERAAAAAAKAREAIGKTPASTAQVGLDSDKKGGGSVTAKDAIRMPQEDFAKLDENALAKLRGDDFDPT